MGQARQLLALQDRRVGQVGCSTVVKVDDCADVDDWADDRLVLAELVIGGLEVGEINAVKRLDVARGFWIVHRCGYQVVEIYGLDVEGLLHLCAAVPQELDDPGLVLRRVEMRLYSLRLGYNLAQSEGGRKNLYEKGFHCHKAISSMTYAPQCAV